MKRHRLFLTLLSCMGICVSCTEFLSPNVASLSLEVLAPTDSLYTAQSEFSFWWEGTDSAEAYRFQLARPAFSEATEVFDTLLTDNLIAFLLAEGRYEWRIRVENAASSSAYQIRQLTVDQTPPTPPEIGFPGPNMRLRIGTDPLQLRWDHADVPIDGERAPVQDSLRLLGPNQELLARFIPSMGIRVWEIDTVIPAGNPGDTLSLQAHVWSTDPAGNLSQPDSLTFFILYP